VTATPPESQSAARRLFAANIRRREERIDLALAALLIAQEQYPRLVIEDYLERLDALAAGLAVEIDLEASPRTIARAIGGFLYDEQGFDGSRDDYFAPENSYLNEVMDRREGIPVTLSILYMEVARRVGVSLQPVAMPGHFLLKMFRDDVELFIDPFNSGAVIDRDGCRALFMRVSGPNAEFRDSMLGAATKRQVIARVLRNLKSIYVERKEYRRALLAADFLLAVMPWDLDEVRDRGLLMARVGRLQEARDDLHTYVEHTPPGPARSAIEATLRSIG
jgi:regulator of sirC expression with transglutaminase-like and TPR domain